MNKNAYIIIIIGSILLVMIFGVYVLLKKDVPVPTPDDSSITVPPTGLPNFPTETQTPTPPSIPQGDLVPDSGQTPISDSEPDSGQIPDSEPTPITYPTPTPTLGSETLMINTPSGQVEINDVLLNPEKVLSGGWGVVVKRTSQYSMVYYEADQGFVISIEDTDVEAARTAVESVFLTTLGISESDACKLNVSLSVPRDINFDLAGKNYRLSFCPNGIPF